MKSVILLVLFVGISFATPILELNAKKPELVANKPELVAAKPELVATKPELIGIKPEQEPVPCAGFDMKNFPPCPGTWQCVCSGTAPFCDGDCDLGWIVISEGDTCPGGGDTCWTGKKYGCALCNAY